MSCFPEHTYATYADGELAPQELRPLEAHLVQCRRCRELVVALREEADLLADVLQEREQWAPAAAPAPPEGAAPARGIALGIGPALAAGLGVLIVSGWLIQTFEPAVELWLAPFTLRGATDMAFDLIFLLRDEAPAFFQLALAIAAMASASALLTFALTMLLRRWQGPGLLALGVLFALALPAADSDAHFGLHKQEDYTLAAGETHDGTLVISANTANIDGVVEGDLLALSHRLTIRGEVRGNVIALAKNLEIPGKVGGSIHVAAGRTHVGGEIDGNLYALSEDFTLARGSRVRRDAAVIGEDVVIEGPVGRDLFLVADRAELRGEVGRDVSGWTERLSLLDGARVGGDVAATLPTGHEIEVASGAEVAGEVTTRHHDVGTAHGLARYGEPGFYVWIALSLAAAFLVGMLLHQLLPAVFDVRVPTAGAFFRALGVGFLVLVAMPVALGICAVTLVGLPVALMGLALYLAALYVGGIVVAALVGTSLVHPAAEGWGAFGLALLAGLLVVTIAVHTPLVGPVVRIVVVILGLGLLAERSRRGWRLIRGLPV